MSATNNHGGWIMDVAELRKTFSARIRKLREDRGLNQGQFADSVGISRGAMSYSNLT
jgi:DNA-binding XRE family transcriptional regulator